MRCDDLNGCVDVMSNRVRVWTAALLLTGIGAARACDCAVDDVETLEWDDLVEAAFFHECRAFNDAALDRLERRLALDDVPADMEPEDVVDLARTTSFVQLGRMLDRGDAAGARIAADALGARLDADAETDAHGDSGDMRVRLAAIAYVLDGSAAAPVDTVIGSPRADWQLASEDCGVPALGFYMHAMLLPSAADAWRATGRADIAVKALLLDRWVDSVSHGLAPTRLRAFADAAFGAGAFDREVRIALSAISIRTTPAGRYASMPLFGIDVPLPLGLDRWCGAGSTMWSDADAVREFMRPLFERRLE